MSDGSRAPHRDRHRSKPLFLDVSHRPVSFVIGVCGQIARGHNSVPEESQALWRSFCLMPRARVPDIGSEQEKIGRKFEEATMTGARLKHYGWGREGEGMNAEEQAFVLGRYRAKFSRDNCEQKPLPRLEDLGLRAPRVTPPASLAAFCTTDRYDRAAHTYGKSYPDYVRGMLGDYENAPDVIAYPRNEAEISAVMDWAGTVSASLTPFGGGSSVCGGVEPRGGGIRYNAGVTLDLREPGQL